MMIDSNSAGPKEFKAVIANYGFAVAIFDGGDGFIPTDPWAA